jgi:23S rRNA (cytidine1920-2'-O)/16S rRNA (cytidine1409-2'-O)-methyltransferase
MNNMKRLDIFLVENDFFNSRNKANEAIKDRNIKVDGKIIDKPSFKIKNSEKIEVLEKKRYVSRAGDKLKEFLKDKDIEINNKICLDVGSSTGGFVQVLLEMNAEKIYAVDVGKGQLHPILKENKKIISKESLDIRELKCEKKFDLVTCDVSFISILYILDSLINFAKNEIIILFKPQFEVGKNVKRDKRGVVKDVNALKRACVKFESELTKHKLQIISKEESKIKGKEGNSEFFYYLKNLNPKVKAYEK